MDGVHGEDSVVHHGNAIAAWAESGGMPRGTSVSIAARIGAAASGSAILVSRATMEATPRSFPVTAERTLELKGIAAPTDVVSIGW